MKLKYGGYTHQDNEVMVKINYDPIDDSEGKQVGSTVRWTLDGMLTGDDQADIKTKIQALETAYGTNGYDLILFHNDGTTHSAHTIFSANTTTGTRVKSFNYPVGSQAEYSTFKHYQIVVEAEIKTNLATNLIKFHEQISFKGNGGPRFIVHEARTGPPIAQMVSEYTPSYAIQSGSAIGNLTYPSYPGPIWPSLENLPERQIVLDGPQVRGVSPRKFGLSWSYSFQSTTPLWGFPNN